MWPRAFQAWPRLPPSVPPSHSPPPPSRGLVPQPAQPLPGQGRVTTHCQGGWGTQLALLGGCPCRGPREPLDTCSLLSQREDSVWAHPTEGGPGLREEDGGGEPALASGRRGGKGRAALCEEGSPAAWSPEPARACDQGATPLLGQGQGGSVSSHWWWLVSLLGPVTCLSRSLSTSVGVLSWGLVCMGVGLRGCASLGQVTVGD